MPFSAGPSAARSIRHAGLRRSSATGGRRRRASCSCGNRRSADDDRQGAESVEPVDQGDTSVAARADFAAATGPRSLRQLEAAEELAQEGLELRDLLWIEPLQELAIADRIGCNRRVDDLEALIRQLDDDSTAIVGIR